LSDETTTSKSNQETVTISTGDIKKIEELQKELQSKTKELEASRIKTNLTANIIKQDTFGASYKNGYEDGTVKEAKKKLLAERKQAKVGTT